MFHGLCGQGFDHLGRAILILNKCQSREAVPVFSFDPAGLSVLGGDGFLADAGKIAALGPKMGEPCGKQRQEIFPIRTQGVGIIQQTARAGCRINQRFVIKQEGN
ncbi:MAG: hypothetical protein KJP02_04305 [Octadecabacter sp.]|nr:hypothetical protein [Octadecabacter sp.]